MSDGIRDNQYVSGECEPATSKAETKSYTLAEMTAERDYIYNKQKQLKEEAEALSGKISNEEKRIREFAKDLTDKDIEFSLTARHQMSDDMRQAMILIAKNGRDNFRRNY